MATRSQRTRALALSFIAAGSGVSAAPCDIYAEGGTPCVAAHATARALYKDYSGPLYQVRRDSDGTTTDISTREAGGVADGDAQDTFCAGTTCVITIIYDQSGSGNDLTQAPGGQAQRGPEEGQFDSLSSASADPIMVNGQKAYGLFIPVHHGYRNNEPNGTAVNDDPEGMYAVLDGTHYNGMCCFDYGNAETDNSDPGATYMESIYFGTGIGSDAGDKGDGDGPWVGADLENGLFGGKDKHKNPDNKSLNSRFVTAIVKGEPGNHWAIRGGDALDGDLITMYDGSRPDGYETMNKEGAIVLGPGGDNSIRGQGTFYEGAMTASYPSEDTESKVQEDIRNAKYEALSLISGPEFKVDSTITLKATTSCCSDRYITHVDGIIKNEIIDDNSDDDLKRRGTWTVRQGLGNPGCYSFESVDSPGSFMVMYSDAYQKNPGPDYEIHIDSKDGADDAKSFGERATFCPQTGFAEGDDLTSLRSWYTPTRFLRHFDGKINAGRNGGFKDFDATFSFSDDATWKLAAGWV